jgi:hypothetical protein
MQSQRKTSSEISVQKEELVLQLKNLADPNDLYLLNARESLPVNQSPLIPSIIGFP